MTQRFVLVVVAVVAYLAGMLTSYAMMKPRTPGGIITTSNRPQLDGPRNGFTGMEFDSPAHGTMIVRHVVRGTPAYKAGITKGDHVVGFGSVMNPNASQAIKVSEASRPGDILPIVVRRGGSEIRVDLQLIDHTEYRRLQALERTSMLGTKRE
jgi:S1-C subfamily serine protease